MRVCVRTPAADGKRKRVEEFASFGTTTPDLWDGDFWLAIAWSIAFSTIGGYGLYG